MRLSEIKKKYRDQWVLVEFSKLDKYLRVKDGKVLAHAPSKEDIYKALLRTRGKNVAIEYCGKMPEDLVVMFCDSKEEALAEGYRLMAEENRKSAEQCIGLFKEIQVGR